MFTQFTWPVYKLAYKELAVSSKLQKMWIRTSDIGGGQFLIRGLIKWRLTLVSLAAAETETVEARRYNKSAPQTKPKPRALLGAPSYGRSVVHCQMNCGARGEIKLGSEGALRTDNRKRCARSRPSTSNCYTMKSVLNATLVSGSRTGNRG